MKINFKEISEQTVWQKFVLNSSFFTFLQSWSWGQFQKMNGNKIFYLGGYLNDRLVLTALIIKFTARRGTFLLCPHGPLLDPSLTEQIVEVYSQFTSFIKNLAKTEKADWFRLNSLLENNLANAERLKKLGYLFAPIHQHAETTWLLNIQAAPVKLLQKMRKTTRYLINRATKEGVTIVKDNSEEGIEAFIKLHQKHAAKTNYEPFSPKYIKNLFIAFNNEEISLKFAKYNGEVEAAAVIIFAGREAAYYLAVSENKHPQFSPAYLLQWHSILEARNKGAERYNFWGVAPDENHNHPLHGVSLFKKGFGGEMLDLLHAYDLPISAKYWLNWLIEKIRSNKRGYYYIKPK